MHLLRGPMTDGVFSASKTNWGAFGFLSLTLPGGSSLQTCSSQSQGSESQPKLIVVGGKQMVMDVSVVATKKNPGTLSFTVEVSETFLPT